MFRPTRHYRKLLNTLEEIRRDQYDPVLRAHIANVYDLCDPTGWRGLQTRIELYGIPVQYQLRHRPSGRRIGARYSTVRELRERFFHKVNVIDNRISVWWRDICGYDVYTLDVESTESLYATAVGELAVFGITPYKPPGNILHPYRNLLIPISDLTIDTEQAVYVPYDSAPVTTCPATWR